MKKTMLLLLCLAFMTATSCTKSDKAPERSPESLSSVMSELETEGFSGSVMIAKEGEVQYSQGMGYANKEAEIPATPATFYDIGSITKGFTKVGILKLVEQGKLSLDAPISEYLENVPADKKAITVRQLLYHTSGLGAYHDTKGDFEEMTKEQALTAIFSQQLPFEPGSKVSYSNSGYTLLAAIIEQVTNQPYTTYLQQEVLQPCELQKTGFYQSTNWKPEEVAMGYGAKTMGEKNSPYKWPKPEWALMGNGGLVSSTEEFYKWLECLHNGKIISKELVQEHLELNSMITGSNDFGFNAVSYRRGDGQTIMAFSNGNDEIITLVMKLLPVLNKEDQKPTDPALEKAVVIRTDALHKALQSGSKAALQQFMQEHIAGNMLKQVSDKALAEGMMEVSSHLGKAITLKEVQKLDKSLYQAAYKANTSDKVASIMLLIESEPPYKIKAFSPRTGVDSGSDATGKAEAADESKPWGLSPENGLASVYIAMFRSFEKGTDEAITAFVNNKMGEDFRNDFPLEAHLNVLKGMRHKLGKDFKVEEIQQKGNGELNLIIRATDGILYQMKAEADPNDPRKLRGFMMSKK